MEAQEIASADLSHWAWLLNLISIPILMGGLMMYLRQQRHIGTSEANGVKVDALHGNVKDGVVEKIKYPDEAGFGNAQTHRMLKESHRIGSEQLAVSRELCDQTKENSIMIREIVTKSNAATTLSTQVNQALLEHLKKKP